MTEEKDMITINFYEGDKIYFSYRTIFFNLVYLKNLVGKDLNDICFDWIVERDMYEKNEISNYIDNSLKNYNNPFSIFKQYADTVWFNIENLSKDILETKYHNEEKSHWLKRIVKTAISCGQKEGKARIKQLKNTYDNQHKEIIIYKVNLTNYSKHDFIDKKDHTYFCHLKPNDYKLFIVYLMKKCKLEKEYAYDLYKQGKNASQLYINLTSLYLNAAFSFMPSKDIKKYFDDTLEEALEYAYSYRKNNKC